MFSRKVFLIILFIFLSSGAACAQKANDPNALSEKFIGIVIDEGPREALTKCLPDDTIRLMGASFQTAVSNFETFMNIYGTIIDYEMVLKEDVTSKVTRTVYYVYTETTVVTFEFYFYKPKDEWTLNFFAFDAQFRIGNPR